MFLIFLSVEAYERLKMVLNAHADNKESIYGQKECIRFAPDVGPYKLEEMRSRFYSLLWCTMHYF